MRKANGLRILLILTASVGIAAIVVWQGVREEKRKLKGPKTLQTSHPVSRPRRINSVAGDFQVFMRHFYQAYRQDWTTAMISLAEQEPKCHEYVDRLIAVAELGSRPNFKGFGFEWAEGQHRSLDPSELVDLAVTLMSARAGRSSPNCSDLKAQQTQAIVEVCNQLFRAALQAAGSDQEPRLSPGAPRVQEARDKLLWASKIAVSLNSNQLEQLVTHGRAWLADRMGNAKKSSSLRIDNFMWPPITYKKGSYTVLSVLPPESTPQNE